MCQDYDIMQKEIRRLHGVCREYRGILEKIEQTAREGIKYYSEIPKEKDKSHAVDAYLTAILNLLKNNE